MTGPTYVLLGASLLVRVVVSCKARERAGLTDATPFVVCLSLVSAGVIHLGDPLDMYGLNMSSLVECPWMTVISLWAIAFATGRVANALILHPASDFRGMVATGHASPGGVYLSLKDYPKQCAMMLGLPMICSQTFMEEFIFRGLLVSLGKWLLGFFGLATGLTGLLSITGSSIVFGLIHFVPAFCCLRGKSIGIPLYALIMPTTLGMVFCALNQASYSLWPGWIVHFGLNYAGFLWDRVFETWEAHGLR